ncbi:MAG: LysM peptidoglycan-binding domain-containing protein [Muribaculum sp.]|nr:LysM peptidoglycan-binding domain-containing protein [Muribaculum sp.]
MLRLIIAGIAFMLSSQAAFAQKDLIILKNGREFNATILQVNDRQVVYKMSSKKNDAEYTLDNADVYMIRFSQRGNVYINENGRRITGENQKLPKDADIIYLIEGREIPAYEVRVFDSHISYLTAKHTNKKVVPIAEVVPRNKVFMIRYTDGTIDLINDMSAKSGTPEVAETIRMESDQEVAGGEQTPTDELLVVFHNVKKGDTLSSIAERYGVTVSDIISWNELPAKMKPTAKLQPDMQIMLYVTPTNSN